MAKAGVAMAAGMAPMAAFFRSKPDSVALWTTVLFSGDIDKMGKKGLDFVLQ